MWKKVNHNPKMICKAGKINFITEHLTTGLDFELWKSNQKHLLNIWNPTRNDYCTSENWTRLWTLIIQPEMIVVQLQTGLDFEVWKYHHKPNKEQLKQSLLYMTSCLLLWLCWFSDCGKKMFKLTEQKRIAHLFFCDTICLSVTYHASVCHFTYLFDERT